MADLCRRHGLRVLGMEDITAVNNGGLEGRCAQGGWRHRALTEAGGKAGPGNPPDLD